MSPLHLGFEAWAAAAAAVHTSERKGQGKRGREGGVEGGGEGKEKGRPCIPGCCTAATCTRLAILEIRPQDTPHGKAHTLEERWPAAREGSADVAGSLRMLHPPRG